MDLIIFAILKHFIKADLK